MNFKFTFDTENIKQNDIVVSLDYDGIRFYHDSNIIILLNYFRFDNKKKGDKFRITYYHKSGAIKNAFYLKDNGERILRLKADKYTYSIILSSQILDSAEEIDEEKSNDELCKDGEMLNMYIGDVILSISNASIDIHSKKNNPSVTIPWISSWSRIL